MNQLKDNYSKVKGTKLCKCRNIMNNPHLYECPVLNDEVKLYEYNTLFNGTVVQQKYVINILLKNQEIFNEFTLEQDIFLRAAK